MGKYHVLSFPQNIATFEVLESKGWYVRMYVRKKITTNYDIFIDQYVKENVTFLIYPKESLIKTEKL